MVRVAYKGAGPALNALLGGEVDLMFPTAGSAAAHVKAGRLHALAFTGAKRLVSLPDVPTVAEAALPGFEADAGWHAVFAPAKTPMALATKFQGAVRNALQIPQVRDHFINNGYEPSGESPAAWAKGYRESLKRLGETAKAAKIEPQ